MTFEGIEGSGKTSQIAALARFLRGLGVPLVVTREPGGTRTGDEIRRILLRPRASGLDPWTELFLVEAARIQHLSEVVRPALRAGRTVLCDRFTDSTVAYQGYGRGLPLPMLRALHELPALGPAPDMTILFDLPVATGLARAVGRNAAAGAARRTRETRIDEEPRAFHARVRRGFLTIARGEPRRVVVVRASSSPEKVQRAIRRTLLPRLPLRARRAAGS